MGYLLLLFALMSLSWIFIVVKVVRRIDFYATYSLYFDIHIFQLDILLISEMFHLYDITSSVPLFRLKYDDFLFMQFSSSNCYSKIIFS